MFETTLSDDQAVTATLHNPSGSCSEFSAAKNRAQRLTVEADRKIFSEDIGSIEITVSRSGLSMQGEMVVNLSGLGPHVGGLPSQVTIEDGQASASVTVSIDDDLEREFDETFVVFASTEGATGALLLNLVDDDTGDWTNKFLPEDINGDRLVTPLDALLLVNFLNGDDEPLLATRPPLLPRAYLDADGNGFVSPTDVLWVINYLNRDIQ